MQPKDSYRNRELYESRTACQPSVRVVFFILLGLVFHCFLLYKTESGYATALAGHRAVILLGAIMEFIIREALAEDAEQIIAYTKAVGGETDNLTFGKSGFPITLEQEKEFLKRVHDNRTSIHLVACKNGKIIGDGSLSGLPRRMCHRAELGLTVRRNYWNQGIGSMILKELIKYAKVNGIEIINLEVRSDNLNAIHLYEKFGFRHIGTSPAYFKIDGHYIDFEIMYLDLR